MKTHRVLGFFLLLTSFSLSAMAAVPRFINFQGRLLDATGRPVTSTKVIEFKLFATLSGGAAMFTETRSVTPDTYGIYNVLLGETASLASIDFDTDGYLEVIVAGETLTPRYRLTSTPYALRADVANAVAWSNITGMPAGFSDNTDDGGAVLGANSVGGYHIIDSSVTTVDVLDGTLLNADLAANAAIALSKLEKDPSATGTLNLSSNPIDWSQLKNVPVGFADGSDDGGATGVDFSSITAQGNHFNASLQLVKLDVSARLPAVDGSLLTNLPAAILDASSVTLQGNVLNVANGLVKLDGSGLLPVLNGSALTNLPAGNLVGTLSATVIASSIAAGAVTDASIVGMNAAKLTGSVATSLLNSSSVTLQGNVFNAVNGLVKLNGSGQLPAIDGSALTNLTAGNLVGTLSATVIASSIAAGAVTNASIVSMNAAKLTGAVATSLLDSSSVTLQGNVFNAASGLVKLGGSGQLPALDASALTNLTAGNLVGTLPGTVIASSIAASAVTNASIVSMNAAKLTGAVATSLLDSSSVTLQGNVFNASNGLVKLNGSGQLPTIDASALTNLTAGNLVGSLPATVIASSIAAGAVTNASIVSVNAAKLTGAIATSLLDSSSVTLQGNVFNATNGLVKLNGSGQLPALDASALTNLASANLVGNLPITVIASSIAANAVTDSSIIGLSARKVAYSAVTKTSAYTATAADNVILCDTSAAGFILGLPSAASVPGKMLIIKKVNLSVLRNVTIDPAGSDDIDGLSTATLIGGAGVLGSAIIVSDGSGWQILNTGL